jgi:hypothetical protein
MNSNAVDSFTISTEGFDGPLLPEGARVVGSPEFQSAVSRFFESQFLEMRVNGLFTGKSAGSKQLYDLPSIRVGRIP